LSDLASRDCVPCKGGVAPLRGTELEALRGQVDPGWQVVGEHHLERELRFANFREALAYVNRVGEMAEAQNHHPDLLLAWGRVRVTIWTHKIDGLTESDFVFAAKCDRLYERP
jgi:4a-hydroxytetrahydrobiopterin dehydratase